MDAETLLAAMPGLARNVAQAYLGPMQAAMKEFAIITVPRCWMWLAQVGHESASLRFMQEIADGSEYEGRVDLGNVHPGDGRRYKGRGPIQLTGRSNYAAAATALGADLVRHPELAAEPRYAFKVSAWWWRAHGLNDISDTGDVAAATRRINGGLNGLADREQRYARCKGLGGAVLPDGDHVPPLHVDFFAIGHNDHHPDVRTWQQKMRDRGWKAEGRPLAVQGSFEKDSDSVCRAFQREKGLLVDGKVGLQTWRTTWTSAVT